MGSRRIDIITELVTRLEAIRLGRESALGVPFDTDAGAMVFQGEAPQLGTSDPDVAVAVLLREDEPQRFNGATWQLVLPVDVQAVCKADLANPWLAAEGIVADIKRAIEIDATLAGLAQDLERGPTLTHPREEGASTVNVSVLYRITYKEPRGNP